MTNDKGSSGLLFRQLAFEQRKEPAYFDWVLVLF